VLEKRRWRAALQNLPEIRVGLLNAPASWSAERSSAFAPPQPLFAAMLVNARKKKC